MVADAVFFQLRVTGLVDVAAVQETADVVSTRLLDDHLAFFDHEFERVFLLFHRHVDDLVLTCRFVHRHHDFDGVTGDVPGVAVFGSAVEPLDEFFHLSRVHVSADGLIAFDEAEIDVFPAVSFGVEEFKHSLTDMEHAFSSADEELASIAIVVPKVRLDEEL